MKRKSLLAFLLLAIVTLVACDEPPVTEADKADQDQAAVQGKMVEEANRQVPVPGIHFFTEKTIVKEIYELRDQNLVTYTYIRDMNGRLHHVCDSIGFGVPYGVEFTNPQRHVGWNGTNGYYGYLIPQPEPNGLFPPTQAEATWVLCTDRNDPKATFKPFYIEDRVIVAPVELNAVDEYLKAPINAKPMEKYEGKIDIVK